jgi:hypothetical protein
MKSKKMRKVSGGNSGVTFGGGFTTEGKLSVESRPEITKTKRTYTTGSEKTKQTGISIEAMPGA